MLQRRDRKVVRTSLIAVADIPEAGATAVEAMIDGQPQSLIVTRRGDTVAAFLNICPHAGRRLDWTPGRFLIDQGRLVCAAHGACFLPHTGACVSGPCRGASLTPVAVEQRANQVFLAGG